MRSQGTFTLSDIPRIEITGHPLLRARTDRPAPPSGRQAQVSAQHAVAVALLRGRAGLAEFSDSAAADPALRAVAGRVSLVDDAGLAVDAARVTLVAHDGAANSCLVEHARGGLARPLSDADLEHKLISLAEHGSSSGGSKIDVRRLIAALWSLDRIEDAASIMSMAGGES